MKCKKGEGKSLPTLPLSPAGQGSALWPPGKRRKYFKIQLHFPWNAWDDPNTSHPCSLSTTVLRHWYFSQNQVARISPVCLLPFGQNALCNCGGSRCPLTAWARQASRGSLEHQHGMSRWLGNGDNLGTGSDLCWSASLLPKLMAGKPAPWPTERTVCSLSQWLQGGNHCSSEPLEPVNLGII